jgi:signal transduction histidine kinase
LLIEYFSIGKIERHSVNFQLSVYRIAQELINNTVKHAKASRALVQLSQQYNSLSLAIEDNGQGFNLTDQTKGTGLQSVRKRVSVMNGQFEIISEPGKGTAIYIGFSI